MEPVGEIWIVDELNVMASMNIIYDRSGIDFTCLNAKPAPTAMITPPTMSAGDGIADGESIAGSHESCGSLQSCNPGHRLVYLTSDD